MIDNTVHLSGLDHEFKWCSINDCPVNDMSQKLVINIGKGKNIPFHCLMCSHFERKEMNIELKVEQALNALEGK